MANRLKFDADTHTYLLGGVWIRAVVLMSASSLILRPSGIFAPHIRSAVPAMISLCTRVSERIQVNAYCFASA